MIKALLGYVLFVLTLYRIWGLLLIKNLEIPINLKVFSINLNVNISLLFYLILIAQ